MEPTMYADVDLERYLDADPDVVSYARASPTIVRVQVTMNGGDPDLPPVDLFIGTGLNDQMVIVLKPVDADGIRAALTAVTDVGVVGVTPFDETIALRFAMFKETSDFMSLINGLQAMVISYYRYLAADGS